MPAMPEQVDTKSAAQASREWPYGPIDFAPISLMEETKRGGFNNYTSPVGMAKPKPSADLPGGRGNADYYEAMETETD